MFVLVAHEMQTLRNNTWRFPDTTGGDIAKEFEEARLPCLKSALSAKIQNLEDRRKNASTQKKKVRPSPKAPRNMANARLRPDFKEWVTAQDSELKRQDTVL